MGRLRVAILAHSTNPRGGVVHALALGEALTKLGHEAVVHAPDATGRGFFRPARCPTTSVEARPVQGSTVDLVRTRIQDYLRHFASAASCDYDLFHAQDAISANALATLVRRRLIPGFVRTVHHVDQFTDPQLADWHDRGIYDAKTLLCVSRVWQDALERDYGLDARIVGNGVDIAEFGPEPTQADAATRERWGLGPGPVFLSVGGFEERKNSLRVIEAFARLRGEYGQGEQVQAQDGRAQNGQAQLVVVGGASLLDHASYQARCRAMLDRAGLDVGPGRAVIQTGPVPQEAMPALYRLADALVFPSLAEGFGLCVLEAMASGTPTIVSRQAPFTEFLGPGDTLFTDPDDPGAIATAMRQALGAGTRARLRPAGLAVAAAHSWRDCAERHLDAYAACTWANIPEDTWASTRANRAMSDA